jgi:hypothetical protein
MNPAGVTPRKRRQVWPWIVGLFLAPIVAVGAMGVNLVHLNSDAARLRDQIMAAAGGGWQTRVQLNLNPVVVGAVRGGLSCVRDLPDEARRALRVVRSASVGVFEQKREAAVRRGDFWRAADETMARRGWTRVVGVVDRREVVLIYVPDGSGRAKPSRVCLAVCNGRQLVVVAAAIRADALSDLVGREIGRHARINL